MISSSVIGRLILPFVALSSILVGVSAGWSDTVPPRGPTVLEDPASPLTPRRARSEADRDQLAAAAHLAYGRLLQRRGKTAKALRQFQRAWRYDPRAHSILLDIVALARQLGRPLETARYAVLHAERKPTNPELMTQLGAWLVEQRSIPRALSLFETAHQLFKEQGKPQRVFALQVETARLYLLVGQPKRAATLFAMVAEVFEDPPSGGLTEKQRNRLIKSPDRMYELMAEAYLKAADYDRAERYFRTADEFRGGEPKLVFDLARVEFARGRMDSARISLDEYLEAQQTTAGIGAYDLLRRILRKTSSDESQVSARLLTQLRTLFDEDPENGVLGYYLAAQLRAAEKWSAAEAIYLDLLDVRPAVQAFQGLAEVYYHQHKPRELLETFANALEQQGATDALTSQSDLVIADKEFLVELLELAAQGSEHSPDSINQRMRLAATLLAVAGGQFEQAETMFRLTLEAKGLPKHEVMRRVGLAMFFADRPGRSAEVLQQALDEQPAGEYLATYYYYLAGALEMAEKTDQAVRAAEKAASLDDSIRFQSRPSWVLYHAGRYEEAEQRYRELIRRFDDKQEPALRRSLRDARLVLSSICVTLDRPAAAEEWLEQVLDEFPEDVGALNDLGYLWADQGEHLERALSMVQRAVAAAPDNDAYRDSLGWAYFRLGRYPEAVRELEKATDTDNPDGVILDHLGDAYFESNDTQQAVETWQRAIRVFDPNRDAKSLEATKKKIERHQQGIVERSLD